MKTFNFKVIIIAVMLILLYSNNLRSQISPINVVFAITNGLNCDISGTWQVLALGSMCVGNSCDNGTFTVSAQSLSNLPIFSGCTPDHEVDCIIITITNIGGNVVNFPITSNTITISTQYSLNNIAQGCTAPASYYMMDNANLYILP